MKEKDFIEIGCLIIPKGVNKEDFKTLCFNEERFWVMTNTRGLLSNVPCIHQVISDLEFPLDEKTFGSQVVVEYISTYDQYIITGTLSKVGNSTFKNEENLIYTKTCREEQGKGNILGLIGNSLLSKFSVFCKNLSNKIAEFSIECFGSKDSKLSLNSSGWVLVNADKGIKLKYQNKKEISILEDKIQIFFSKEQKITLQDKQLIYEDGINTLKINESGYYLGNIEIPTFLTEILDFLGNDAMLLTSCGPSSMGMMSTSSGPKLMKLKQKLNQINQK